MNFGDPDGFGQYGILDHDEAGKLLCHECGRWWNQLATHLRGAHQIEAADYRRDHGLGTTTRLVGRSVRQKLAAAYDLHRDEHLADLERSRNPQEAVRNTIAHRGGEWAPEVRAKRQAVGRASRTPDLTEQQLEQLGDSTDLQRWADRARTLIERDGISLASLGRAADISPATVGQRLRRYAPS